MAELLSVQTDDVSVISKEEYEEKSTESTTNERTTKHRKRS